MDFSKLNGLVAAVIQDATTREVLMVGFMNQAALDRTVESGFATFFSRTRNKLWMKGETSGNRLQVDRILVDCDDDTLLLLVRPLGDGNVCHTGERTCFFRDLDTGTGRPDQAHRRSGRRRRRRRVPSRLPAACAGPQALRSNRDERATASSPSRSGRYFLGAQRSRGRARSRRRQAG